MRFVPTSLIVSTSLFLYSLVCPFCVLVTKALSSLRIKSPSGAAAAVEGDAPCGCRREIAPTTDRDPHSPPFRALHGSSCALHIGEEPQARPVREGADAGEKERADIDVES